MSFLSSVKLKVLLRDSNSINNYTQLRSQGLFSRRYPNCRKAAKGPGNQVIICYV